MRKFIPMITLLTICGCQQNVVVPMAKDLIDNRQLLTELQGKCNTGEYSHLPADQKANLCSTTQDASVSIAEIEAGKKAEEFYNANTKRK